jgi:hypothetical protein
MVYKPKVNPGIGLASRFLMIFLFLFSKMAQNSFSYPQKKRATVARCPLKSY